MASAENVPALVAAMQSGDLATLQRLLAEQPGLASSPLGGSLGTRTPLHVVTDWPGYVANGSPRWINQGGPWKAPVTVHTIAAPNPFAMALAFTFNGVTPYADAYVSKHTDAPDSLESALRNAPPGATVDGAVYWQVYRALVTNVVLLNPQTGEHLAQWNLWQPGAPLP